MGIFSKLFKKSGVSEKESARESSSSFSTPVGEVNISVSVSTPQCNPEIPPLQGDYAKAVFLWAFSRPQPIRENGNYAAYFLYECGIRDCAKYHKKLTEEGYFIEAKPGEALELFKLPELKDMLRELNQPVSGKKAVLIERILENAEEGFLRAHVPETIYKLSSEGTAFLQEHDAYVQIHKNKNWGVSWQEYDRYAKPGQDYLTTMWVIFNTQLKNSKPEESRNLYYYLYSILLEQGKRSDALEMLLRVLYLDMSGIHAKVMFDLYRQKVYTKKQLKEYADTIAALAPGIVYPLEKFRDIYDSEMIDVLYMWKLPIQICDKELFRTIIESAVSGTYDEEQANKKLRAAYNKFVDKL